MECVGATLGYDAESVAANNWTLAEQTPSLPCLPRAWMQLTRYADVVLPTALGDFEGENVVDVVEPQHVVITKKTKSVLVPVDLRLAKPKGFVFR